MASFAHLKSYPFFKEISHWFYPFTMQQPEVYKHFKNLSKAFDILEKSVKLSRIFSVILRLGNFLNGGSSRGGISGFKIESLDKLKELRSTQSSYTLLHYVVETMEKHYPSECDLTTEGEVLTVASKADLDNISKCLSALQAAMTKCTRFMPQAENLVIDGDLFHPKFTEFSSNKEEHLAELKSQLEATQKRSNEIITMYGEQPAKMKLSDFLETFQRFVTEFMNAKQELAKKKAQEEKKKEMAAKARERKASVAKRGNLDQLMSSLADGSGLDKMRKPKRLSVVGKIMPIQQASPNDLQAAFLKVRGKK